jgi:hypothetical protein
MSVLKVAAIQNPSAATAAITLDANGGALIGGQAAYARNLLYNGAMQVAQRGTSSASVTAGSASYLTADRWSLILDTMGTWTQSVENDAPTGSGFRKSLKMLCTTADAAPAGADRILLAHRLEGQDLQRIAKGTSSAQQLTLSFWVKSNVTGTHVTELVDSDNSRNVSASYSVSASATWEKKTITFPADTTGVFDNDNALSFSLLFYLGAGSDFTSGTLATSWGTPTAANRAPGQTNLAAATDNYWQVTGVQLEVGPVATPFEFKSFGQELRECQRYFQRLGGFTGVAGNTTYVAMIQTLNVPMRVAPATSATAAIKITDAVTTDFTQSSPDAVIAAAGVRTTPTAVQLVLNNFTGLTTGKVYMHIPDSSSGLVNYSAEL